MLHPLRMLRRIRSISSDDIYIYVYMCVRVSIAVEPYLPVVRKGRATLAHVFALFVKPAGLPIRAAPLMVFFPVFICIP